MDIKDKFVSQIPSDMNAIECFSGYWYSKFPPPYESITGAHELFNDPRLKWALNCLQPKPSWNIVELGPLEGAHSYFMEKNYDINSITAIEANRLCWLRCLITKEVLKLKNTRFLLGNFLEHLRQPSVGFDFGLVFGVLYHMSDPLELLSLLSMTCDRIALWTQFATESQKGKWSRVELSNGNFSALGYVNDYGAGSEQDNFIGGVEKKSVWMTRETILNALNFFGYKNITEWKVSENQFGGELTLVASFS